MGLGLYARTIRISRRDMRRRQLQNSPSGSPPHIPVGCIRWLGGSCGNELLRIFIKSIGTDILLMRPDHSTALYARLCEVADVPKLFKNAEVQERSAVIYTHLAIGKCELKPVAFFRRNCLDSRIHGLPQWFDLERLLAAYRELPIGHEIIPVNLNPG